MSRTNGYGSQVFTTGQVAKFCHVAARTVGKWFDAGHLRGYRIPGSNDRRVTRAEVVRFMRHHAMPLPPELEGGPLPVVVATPEPLVAGRIAEALMGEPVRVEHAASYFELGVLARQSPGVVVLDMALGRSEGLRVLEALPRVVVLADEDEPDLGGLRALAADVFQKPCDLALLAERLLSPAAE